MNFKITLVLLFKKKKKKEKELIEIDRASMNLTSSIL